VVLLHRSSSLPSRAAPKGTRESCRAASRAQENLNLPHFTDFSYTYPPPPVFTLQPVYFFASVYLMLNPLRVQYRRCVFRVRHESPSGPRREWQTVVDGTAQILFASDVALGGLNRCVSKQKLDLFQLAPSGMAQAGAASQIVRSQRLDANPVCAGLDNVPNPVLGNAVSPNRAVLAN
jgi:hypothetical protein